MFQTGKMDHDNRQEYEQTTTSQDIRDLYGVYDVATDAKRLMQVPGGQGTVHFPDPSTAGYSKRTEGAAMSSKSSIESGSVERTYRIDDSYEIKPISKFAAQTGVLTQGDKMDAGQNYN
jgi:hypothetical protein